MAVVPLLSDFPPSIARNDYTGSVGMSFRVARSIVVTHIGRPVKTATSLAASHAMRLYEDGVLVASATIADASPRDNGWAYESIGTPFTMVIVKDYIICTDETNGGDQWQNILTLTGVSSADFDLTYFYSVYGAAGGLPGSPSTNGTAYVWNNLFETSGAFLPFHKRKQNSLIGR